MNHKQKFKGRHREISHRSIFNSTTIPVIEFVKLVFANSLTHLLDVVLNTNIQ